MVFMGTPEFALPAFEAMAASHHLVAVVTQPDRPSGRGGRLTPSPVKTVALLRHLSVFQPERIRKDPAFLEALQRLAPDLIVVVAFGQILPPSVLSIPRLGCVNLHASLLPAYRGAAPIQWSIIRGETTTGVTTMQMDAGMDTGPILLQRKTPIEPTETAVSVGKRLAHAGAPLLLETVERLATGTLIASPQNNEGGTAAPPLAKEDGLIRWTESAREIFNRWRGTLPWPGTTTFYNGLRWKIPTMEIGSETGRTGGPGEILGMSDGRLEVAAGAGYIRVKEIQPEGSRCMSVAEYAAGHTVRPHTFLERMETST
jgi:methionyl-tRNA formyltransferase